MCEGTRTDKSILTEGIKNGFYQVTLEEKQIPEFIVRLSVNEKKTKEFIHLFGLSVANKKLSKCKSCIVGKMHQLTYISRNISSNSLLDLIYKNVGGPASVISELKIKCYVFVCQRCHKAQMDFISSFKKIRCS